MAEYNITLPSQPRVVSEERDRGIYEIDNLYPGYGHTLGNSLRRIILSSLPGAAITSLKIAGITHEFSTIAGIKEDVITIILNLKRTRFKLITDEPATASLKIKGVKKVTAGDIQVSGQLEILNKDLPIAELTEKNSELEIQMTVERGLGFLSREALRKEKTEIGTIAMDAVFSPIRRVAYEVENMRVGDRTDFNRLRITIETDGSLSPREALENSITIMIHQLKAVVGFQETETKLPPALAALANVQGASAAAENKEVAEAMKMKIESLDFSTRTQNALVDAGVRTLGGLARKKQQDLLGIEGMGEKGLQEIKRILGNYGIVLK